MEGLGTFSSGRKAGDGSGGFGVRLLIAFVAAAATFALISTTASAKLTRPYLASFGTFSSVQGVAIDQGSEDVYVYDGGGEAIYRFDAVGNPVDFTSTGTNKIAAVPFAGSGEGEIAVDDSSGPAKGDIYVAHASSENVLVYDEAGNKIGEITEEAGKPWGEACGVAVGSSGEVYVGLYPSNVDEYLPTSAVVKDSDYVGTYEGMRSPCNVAADPADDLFVDSWEEGPVTSFAPSQLGVALAVGTVIDKAGTTLAVDPATEGVFIDEEDQISQFGPKGKPEEEPLVVFGESGPGTLEDSIGIAVNGKSNEVYAASGKGAIDVFGPAVVLPDAKTTAASNILAETATVNGEADPEGLEVEECYFEYGESESYGHVAACTEMPSQIGSGTAYVKVHADLSGLKGNVVYHYRLVVGNENGSAYGGDTTFAFLSPAVEDEYAADVNGSGATLGGSLDPNGLPTEYQFEYGTSSSYGSSTSTRQARGSAFVAVQAHIGELLAETTYHYRLVATNAAGTTTGPDLTFATQGPGGLLSLLDGRQWELVSPPVKYGAGILTEAAGGGSVVQASASGNAITYIASNPIEDEPEGNSAPENSQIISRRGANGIWSSKTLDLPNEEVHPLPIGHGLAFKMFSPELTLGAFEVYGHTVLAPNATEERAPYLRNEVACNEKSSGCFIPTLTLDDTMPGAKWDNQPEGLFIETHFIDASENVEHIVMSSEQPLTQGASADGLYEWSTDGNLENMSINEVGESVPGALGGREQANVRGSISSDGTRVFWCETTFYGCSYGEGLFVRDTTTGESLKIGTGEFQIATEDGSHVFYSDASGLKECTIVEAVGKLACESSVVAPEIDGLVMGINPSGTTVYFDTEEALTAGAEAKGNNLYVSHFENEKWEPHLIAVLDQSHEGYGGDTSDWGEPHSVSWMTSRVSPNGRYLAFLSDRSLTGYDNRDAVSGEPDEEVFLYDDQEHKLVCASCSNTNARPDGVEFGAAETSELIEAHDVLAEKWVAADIPPGQESDLEHSTRQSRYLTNDGQLFFNSVTSLVPQDTNGLGDVYEYEPDEAGSCMKTEGCVQLISAGTSGEESAFLEASEGGSNVFFVTTAQLTPQDTDTEFDVYDARVCSEAEPCTQAPVSPPPCSSGEACKPAQTPQPTIYGAPASATFSGAGNPPRESGKTTTKSKKAKSKAVTERRLRQALKRCKRSDANRPGKKRRCEAKARKRLGGFASRLAARKSRDVRSTVLQNGQNGRGR
ncbi:MAG TPA: hypothetical protein VGF95_15745 [Solirubrobacteraceae bacterium]